MQRANQNRRNAQGERLVLVLVSGRERRARLFLAGYKAVTKGLNDTRARSRPEDYMLLSSGKEHVLLTKLVNYVDYHGILMA